MKNRILYRRLETNRYLMYHNSKQNGHQQAKSGVDRIATHGIVKKTQKTPLKEITKAEEIRKEYFNNKKK